MKAYALVENTKTGECDENILDVSTAAEAIQRGEKDWQHLTAHDRKRRDFFAIMHGEIDEDGCFDSNSADIVMEWCVTRFGETRRIIHSATKKIVDFFSGDVVAETTSDGSANLEEVIALCGGIIIDDEDDERFLDNGENVIIGGNRYELKYLVLSC